MDEIDFKIIDILKQDARIPYTKIAQKLGIGTDTVIRRYKKLLKTGVISKPTLVLNSKICGFKGIVDFYIKIEPGKKVENTIIQLEKVRNLVNIGKLLGDSDLLGNGFFTDFTDLAELTKTVKKIDNLHSVDISVYVGPNWLIPLDFEVGQTHV